MAVILSVRSWKDYHAGESPFLSVFSYIGILGAAGIVNFILLTAALSSCNSGIYSTGRMLRSLAHTGDAPKQLTRLSKRRVPALGICASAAMMVIGVVVNALDPKHAFAYITAVSTVGIIVIWATILLCQMAFRRKVTVANYLPRITGSPAPR